MSLPAVSLSEPPLVLSIQSHVAWGHVGNAAALLPMQLLGVQPIPVHTVQFSNHTGYGTFKGEVFAASHIRDVLAGLAERGVLARCAAVLSGYLGDAETGRVIVEAVRTIRRDNRAVRYLCDPVIGDTWRGVFVRPGIPEFLRDEALPVADILTPNQFEFEYLAGRAVTSVTEAVQVARSLLRAPGEGPSLLAITSLQTPDLPLDTIGTLAVTPDAAWLVQTPLLELSPMPSGMGDVFAAIFLAAQVSGEAVPDALAHAVGSLYGLLRHQVPGVRELPLVAARQQVLAPTPPCHAIAL